MKPVILSILIGILIGGHLLAIVPQNVPDAPHPDAVMFCAMEHKEENGKCTCADPDMGGVACTLNDNNRPRGCKWQCGHAKSCACCAS